MISTTIQYNKTILKQYLYTILYQWYDAKWWKWTDSFGSQVINYNITQLFSYQNIQTKEEEACRVNDIEFLISPNNFDQDKFNRNFVIFVPAIFNRNSQEISDRVGNVIILVWECTNDVQHLLVLLDYEPKINFS